MCDIFNLFFLNLLFEPGYLQVCVRECVGVVVQVKCSSLFFLVKVVLVGHKDCSSKVECGGLSLAISINSQLTICLPGIC